MTTSGGSSVEDVERERAKAVQARRRRQQAELAPPTFRNSAAVIQSLTATEWMLAGPAETGKTWATLWRLDQLLRTTPKAMGAIVRKIRADMDGTVLNTYRKVLARSGSGAQPYGGKTPQWYDYPNGARLYIGGMDRPGKILSGERDFIYVNQAEELSLDDWETLSTRTTGRGAVTETPMLFGDCNPGPPSHWILNRPRLQVLYSRHEDNPSLYDDDGNLTAQGVRTMAALDALTGVRKKRLRFGLWVGAEGTVYEFDRSIHVVPSMPAGWQSWRKIRVIDFGYINPFVCQWWAISPDSDMYMYREIYMTGRTVAQHVKTIKRYSRGEDYEANIADHDAEDRATLREHGIQTIAAKKEVSRGIQKVEERLALTRQGKPRMFFLANALVERDQTLLDQFLPTCTVEEFDVYVWPQSVDGKPLKEAPVKLYDHGMDTTRYATMYIDKPAKRNRRRTTVSFTSYY